MRIAQTSDFSYEHALAWVRFRQGGQNGILSPEIEVNDESRPGPSEQPAG